MNKQTDDIKEMRTIVDKLNIASKHYYNDGVELITNFEYDYLEERLKQLEKKTGIILSNSPTNNIGYEVITTRHKIQHEYPSLSLDKTKDCSKMAEWLGEYSGVLSWKCDGLTIVLTYDNGELVLAATRGNGIIGEDVTNNVRYFKNVPLRINDKRHIVIRGEALISYPTFERINKSLTDDKRYKNPRNMAAGALRFTNPKQTSEYSVEFKAFDLVNARELGFKLVSDSLNFVDSLGVTTVDRWIVTNETIESIIYEKENEIENLLYPADGLVVIYNDLFSHDILGSTKKFPKYAKAFKWQDEMKITILRKVDWSVAKSGLLSPVAIFDPVELEGTTVKRASVHNITIMQELGLGIGDRISVYKANMIIPQIHDDMEKSNNIPIPDKCPLCGSTLELRIGSNNKSMFLYCINENCPR